MEVWEAARGTLQATLQGEHRKIVGSLEFSLDGKRLLTADDHMVRIWETKTGKVLTTAEGCCEAYSSPDEQRIVTLGSKTASICDAKSGKLVANLRHDDFVRSLEFCRDGEHVLTTSDDKMARVWTILPPGADTQPPWFVDFLHYMAQHRLNSDGGLEPIRPADWLAIRERLREVVRETATQDTPYLRILRHFVHE